MPGISKDAIRIRSYSKEDQDQVVEILTIGFQENAEPLFRRRVKHYTTPLVILTKSIIYTSLIELAFAVYSIYISKSSSSSSSSSTFFAGVSWDNPRSFQKLLPSPESALALIQPSFSIVWVLVTLIVAITTLLEMYRWSLRSNEKFIKTCIQEDLDDITGYYQSSSSTNNKPNRSQFWVACLDSHPQLVLGCIALDDIWAHTEHLKSKHLKRGRSEDAFTIPNKTDAGLRRLSVHPHYRRLGISKMLMDMVVTYAKANEFRRLVFSTTLFQDKAIAGYIRYGFTKDKTAKLATFIDLWFGSMDLYATEQEKEEQRAKQAAMLREIGVA
ncbi:N-acetylaspartate synthetase [Gamsiella multidivaricata]|nr:N-acetylaspartate synthetase [Gamsiella multidivaricata]